MSDHSGPPVRVFAVGPRKEQRVMIGEGAVREDVQDTGAWISALADNVVDLEGHR
jgi:hypothetical protein